MLTQFFRRVSVIHEIDGDIISMVEFPSLENSNLYSSFIEWIRLTVFGEVIYITLYANKNVPFSLKLIVTIFKMPLCPLPPH